MSRHRAVKFRPLNRQIIGTPSVNTQTWRVPRSRNRELVPARRCAQQCAVKVRDVPCGGAYGYRAPRRALKKGIRPRGVFYPPLIGLATEFRRCPVPIVYGAVRASVPVYTIWESQGWYAACARGMMHTLNSHQVSAYRRAGLGIDGRGRYSVGEQQPDRHICRGSRLGQVGPRPSHRR
jgi:hypothetical protein